MMKTNLLIPSLLAIGILFLPSGGTGIANAAEKDPCIYPPIHFDKMIELGQAQAKGLITETKWSTIKRYTDEIKKRYPKSPSVNNPKTSRWITWTLIEDTPFRRLRRVFRKDTYLMFRWNEGCIRQMWFISGPSKKKLDQGT